MRRRPLRSGRCLAALSLLATPALAQTETHVYAQINGVPIELDMRRPVSAGPTPLIIWIHGGGWRNGNREIPDILDRFLDDGYAIASIDYRFTNQAADWNGAPVTWPAQAHDCKAAVRWLRANAGALNLDPCAFVAFGSSSGGQLAAVLGTSNGDAFLEGDVGAFDAVSSDVQLAVDYHGHTDLLFLNPDVTDPPGSVIDHDHFNSSVSRLLGSAISGFSVGEIRAHIGDPTPPWPELVALADTAAAATLALDPAGNVPMFITHGEQDPVVPHAQSVRLFDALTLAGTPVVFRSDPDAAHGLANTPDVITDEAKAWIDAQLALLPACGCAADLSGNSALDFNDVVMFFDAFNTQDPAADVAPPTGVLDFNDVVEYLSVFALGCP